MHASTVIFPQSGALLGGSIGGEAQSNVEDVSTLHYFKKYAIVTRRCFHAESVNLSVDRVADDQLLCRPYQMVMIGIQCVVIPNGVRKRKFSDLRTVRSRFVGFAHVIQQATNAGSATISQWLEEEGG